MQQNRLYYKAARTGFFADGRERRNTGRIKKRKRQKGQQIGGVKHCEARREHQQYRYNRFFGE